MPTAGWTPCSKPWRRSSAEREIFDVPLDLCLAAPFGHEVLEACARVPFGTTSTYARIAADAGRPAASRAAGNALGANPVPIVVPCHRVLRTGGGIGGYTGGLQVKEHLLALEGVAISGEQNRDRRPAEDF